MKSFFKTLFEYNEDHYILIWIYDGDQRKESHWFKSHSAAVEFVESQKKKVNTYVGVGVSPENYGPNKRCLQKDIAGIPALWLDIDIADSVHKKKNLPATMDEAMRLFEAIEAKPTMIISSGHGLQAWWVFKEPWLFDSSAERKDAAAMAKRFIYAFKAFAVNFGWDVDSVHNLDRVLRVPGTTNCKNKHVPVTLLENNDIRYEPSYFDEILPALTDTKDYSTIKAGDLILDPNASPPFHKFEALKEIELRFYQAWEHKRKDMQDQSASSYDLALANYTAMAGWSDQEICNLLIAHRAKHGEDLKLRQDYYQRTIGIAAKNSERYKAEEELLQLSDAEYETTELDAGKKDLLLQQVSLLFKIKIIQITKYLTDPPSYRIVTAVGSISLGDVDNLIGQGKLRNKLAAATGKFLPRFKPAMWDSIAQHILNCCTDQEIGEEATERGQIQTWLQQYMQDKHIFDSAEEALVNNDPFRQDGDVYIFGNSLRTWIRIVHLERITPKQLGTMLRRIDAEPLKINVELESGRTSRSVWKLEKGEI